MLSRKSRTKNAQGLKLSNAAMTTVNNGKRYAGGVDPAEERDRQRRVALSRRSKLTFADLRHAVGATVANASLDRTQDIPARLVVESHEYRDSHDGTRHPRLLEAGCLEYAFIERCVLLVAPDLIVPYGEAGMFPDQLFQELLFPLTMGTAVAPEQRDDRTRLIAPRRLRPGPEARKRPPSEAGCRRQAGNLTLSASGLRAASLHLKRELFHQRPGPRRGFPALSGERRPGR